MRFKVVVSFFIGVLLAGGCANLPQPVGPNDGKCHGPDYNAPTCVYRF